MEGLIFNGTSGVLIVNKWFALNPIESPFNFQVWQLITYQFLHGGFTHILFNMFALWMFGFEIESMWGPKKFLLFYLMAGVVAGLFQLFLTPMLGGSPAPTIGASGAVYGVLIAFAMIFPDRYIYLYFLIPVKAKYLIGFLIVMEFLLVDSANSGVAHLAHLGGALAGFIFILLDKKTHVPLKNIFRNRQFKSTSSSSPFGRFNGNESEIEDARFTEINNGTKDKSEITQEEIDAILDKISQSGYQNLTDKEKRILFEASKKMK
ncbi:MAG: rhomboid family intramembrane serine protease [Ignavibacteriaceae bacterium]|nr:rhomboid family intramembrane serine protease [Ignavibacteriaceae bacterium]